MPAGAIPLAAFGHLSDAIKAIGSPPSADDISHHFAAGVYAKEMRVAAGLVVLSHKHLHDHLSILASGTVTVTTEAGDTVHEAPAVITIKAGEHHSIFAHSDAVWFCVHATDETDPAKVDEVLVA